MNQHSTTGRAALDGRAQKGDTQTQPGMENVMNFTSIQPQGLQEQFVCQSCGDWNTHVDVVDVTDQGGTTRVTAGGEGGRTRIDMRDERDQGRRHTITLHYSCENCAQNGAISFQQHKGNTLVRRHGWSTDERFGIVAAPVFTPHPFEV